jgi:hypothetical protein
MAARLRFSIFEAKEPKVSSLSSSYLSSKSALTCQLIQVTPGDLKGHSGVEISTHNSLVGLISMS